MLRVFAAAELVKLQKTKSAETAAANSGLAIGPEAHRSVPIAAQYYPPAPNSSTKYIIDTID